MIAAISPADINYDETLSTLRYFFVNASHATTIRTIKWQFNPIRLH